MRGLRRFGIFLLCLVLFLGGVALGGYLFRGTQPRSFLSPERCRERCWDQAELLGLIGSVIVQRNPKLLPNVLYETDKSVAIDYPLDHIGNHFVVIPKKDIRNIGEVSEGDEAYLLDAFAVIGQLAKDRNIRSYRVVTYGPERQDVSYLHFHLVESGAT